MNGVSDTKECTQDATQNVKEGRRSARVPRSVYRLLMLEFIQYSFYKSFCDFHVTFIRHFHSMPSAVSDATDKVKGWMNGVSDKTKEYSQDADQKAKDLGRDAADKAKEATQNVKDLGRDAAEKTKDAAQKVKDFGRDSNAEKRHDNPR